MVRALRMRNFPGPQSRHVALRAIRFLRMMLRRQRLTMTVQTFATVERRLLRRRRLRVRIMTAPAPHLVSRPPLALAEGQRLNLAQPPRRLRLVSAEQEIMDVIGKSLSRLKLIKMLARLIHRHGPLEVALHANRIPPIRRQLRGIHDCRADDRRRDSRHLTRAVSDIRTMTPFATDPRMQKWRSGEFIFRPRQRRLQPAAVTIHAIRKRRQIHGNFPRLRVTRRHSPSAFLRIPKDWSLKQKPLLRKQIPPPFSARP